jgi:hypothetical protein
MEPGAYTSSTYLDRIELATPCSIPNSSPLLRLPAELRLQIYISIITPDIGSWVLEEPHYRRKARRRQPDGWFFDFLPTGEARLQEFQAVESARAWRHLSIFSVSRQIYNEAHLLPFSTTAFVFNSARLLRCLEKLSEEQKSKMTAIEIQLIVTRDGELYFGREVLRKEEWLDAVGQLTGLKRIDLAIGYASTRMREDLVGDFVGKGIEAADAKVRQWIEEAMSRHVEIRVRTERLVKLKGKGVLETT